MEEGESLSDEDVDADEDGEAISDEDEDGFVVKDGELSEGEGVKDEGELRTTRWTSTTSAPTTKVWISWAPNSRQVRRTD